MLSVLFIISLQANAQDTICTRENYCFAAKIISVDRKEVRFKYPETENDTLHHLRNDKLLKIKYLNGEEKYFVSFLKLVAVGISAYYTSSPTRRYDITKYSSAGSLDFFSAGVLLTGYYRGNVMGISVSTGYSKKSIDRRESYQYTNAQNSFHNLSETIESTSIPFYITPRVNLGKEEIIPFFDLTIGIEFFQKGTVAENHTLQSPLIWKTGFGLQAIAFQHWIFEFKLGFGTRPDFRSNTGKAYLVGNFELSFYRILYSHTRH